MCVNPLKILNDHIDGLKRILEQQKSPLAANSLMLRPQRTQNRIKLVKMSIQRTFLLMPLRDAVPTLVFLIQDLTAILVPMRITRSTTHVMDGSATS